MGSSSSPAPSSYDDRRPGRRRAMIAATPERSVMWRAGTALVLVAACSGGNGSSPDDATVPSDGVADADTDTDADSDVDTDADSDTVTGGGVAVLGGGTHDLANVVVTEVLTAADDLHLPS